MLLSASAGSSASRKLLRDLFSTSGATFIFLLLGYGVKYAYTFLITRKLGAYAMGVFSLSFTVIQISAVIARLGIDASLLRFMSGYRFRNELGKIRQLYLSGMSLVLMSSLLITVFVYVMAPWLAAVVFRDQGMTYAFRIASLGIVPLALVYLQVESLRGLGCIKWYAFFLYSSTFLLGSLLLIVFLSFSGAVQLPVQVFVGAVWLTFLMAAGCFLGASSFFATVSRPALSIGALLKNSLPLMLAASILLLMGWVDIIMLGMMKTPAEVGVYHVVVRVASIAIIPAVAINSIATRKFAELYEIDDLPGLMGFIRQTSRLFFYASFPLVLILGISASFVLHLFGSEFHTGSLALRILLIGQFMPAFSGSIGNILKMTNNQVPLQYFMAAALGINIVLNGLLIPRYSIEGAAVASALSMTFWNVAGGIFFYRRYGVNTFFVPILSRKKTVGK